MDWPEGHRLATAIQFRFPECPKIPLGTLITRASAQGLQILSDFLFWDPEKRPSAQQSQRYPYFQNVKMNSSATNRPTLQSMQMQQQISGAGNERRSIIELESTENNGMLSRFSFNPKFSSSDMNEMNSIISASRLSQHPSEKQFILDKQSSEGNKVNESLNNSTKAFVAYKNGINFSILNDMFSNVNIKPENNNNAANKKQSDEPVYSEVIKKNGIKPEDIAEQNGSEKVNDVYINLFKESKPELSAPKKDSVEKHQPTVEEPIKNGFFLHDPKKPALLPKTFKVVRTNEQSARKAIDESLSNEPKVYNMFSKNPSDEELLNLNGSKKQINLSGKNVSMAPKNISKWTDSFEDDELATILG